MKNETLHDSNRIKTIDLFIILLLSLLCFGYLGVLRSYQSYIISVAMLIIITLIIFKQFSLKKISVLWGILYLYIIINAINLNLELGIKYIIILTVGVMLLMLSKKVSFYEKLMDIFEIIAVVFAIVTLLNVVYPDIVIVYLGFMIPTSQIGTIRSNLFWGGFPGLAGELSYNAFCLAIGFGVIFGKFISRKKQKNKNIILLLLMFVAIFLTAKRSFLLIVPSAAMLIFFLVSFKGKGSKKILCVITIMLLPIIYELFLSRIITDLLNKGQDTIDLSNRDFFWNIAIKMIKNKPIFGNGINSYDIFFNRATGHEGYAGAHNSYLQITAELGIFGSVMYFGIVYGLAYRTIKALNWAVKSNKETELYLITISLFIQLVCIIYAISGNPFYQQQQLLVYFLFAGIAIKMIYTQKISIRNSENERRCS